MDLLDIEIVSVRGRVEEETKEIERLEKKIEKHREFRRTLTVMLGVFMEADKLRPAKDKKQVMLGCDYPGEWQREITYDGRYA